MKKLGEDTENGVTNHLILWIDRKTETIAKHRWCRGLSEVSRILTQVKDEATEKDWYAVSPDPREVVRKSQGRATMCSRQSVIDEINFQRDVEEARRRR